MGMSSKQGAARAGKDLTIAVLGLVLKGSLALGVVRFPTSHPLFDRRRLLRKLQDMEHLGYIKHARKSYSVTPQGRKLLIEDAVWNLSIPTPTHWDKKWRLVMFDIPTDKKKRRDIFRLRLKELGLLLYQDSVWVYPYPVREVAIKIATFYFLLPHVSFVVADSISGEKKLKKHFHLD